MYIYIYIYIYTCAYIYIYTHLHVCDPRRAHQLVHSLAAVVLEDSRESATLRFELSVLEYGYVFQNQQTSTNKLTKPTKLHQHQDIPLSNLTFENRFVDDQTLA